MKILFVCKYNRFRSRIAEIYFKKINKNKSIQTTSAGIIEGWLPLDENEVKVAKKLGIKIEGKPKTISTEILRKTDKVIIVANDVPKSLFNEVYISQKKKIRFNSKNRITLWKTPDVDIGDSNEKIEKIIKSIMLKVGGLVKQLEVRK